MNLQKPTIIHYGDPRGLAVRDAISDLGIQLLKGEINSDKYYTERAKIEDAWKTQSALNEMLEAELQ